MCLQITVTNVILCEQLSQYKATRFHLSQHLASETRTLSQWHYIPSYCTLIVEITICMTPPSSKLPPTSYYVTMLLPDTIDYINDRAKTINALVSVIPQYRGLDTYLTLQGQPP